MTEILKKSNEWIETQKDNSELKELNDEILQNISNEDFLKVWIDKRIQALTKPKTEAKNIKKDDEININFTFNTKLNKALYLNTTAGQILPEQVFSVEVNWNIYNRIEGSLYWEFFDKNNKRLTIHDRTKIKIIETRNTDQISQIRTEITKNIESKKTPLEKYIAEVALEKWIDEKLLYILAKDQFDEELFDIDESEKENLKKLLENKDYIKLQLELLATNISRWLNWKSEIKNWKYSVTTVSSILKNTFPSKWKQKMKDYWYDDKVLEDFEKNNYTIEVSSLWSLNNLWENSPSTINNEKYWTYQLSWENLISFANTNDIKWSIWSEEFKNNWNLKVNAIWKKAFQKLEYDFVKEKIYEAQLLKLKSQNIDTSKFSLVFKNIIWSSALEHWKNTNIILDAINYLKLEWKDIYSLSNQEKIINTIYDFRNREKPENIDNHKIELQKALNLIKSSFVWEYNILSKEAKRSESGTTLCSQTAYFNLANFWIEAPRLWSAFESMRAYEAWRLTKSFSQDARVADLFFDASPKNRQYWHRAVWININWEWFVLDPYLPIWWKPPSRNPIKLDEYMTYINNSGRDFKWWVFYS